MGVSDNVELEYTCFVRSHKHDPWVPKIFSMRYPTTCKVFSGYSSISEVEHGSSACTVDNPFAKARGLSFHIGGRTMLCLTLYRAVLMKLENAAFIMVPHENQLTEAEAVTTKCVLRGPTYGKY